MGADCARLHKKRNALHPASAPAATQARTRNGDGSMKVRWIILGLAGLIVIAAWAAVAIAYFFFDPSIAIWTLLVTMGAFSIEGFLWVGAGVLGWSFLAGRRATLQRWKRRLFG
jgi:hypothetical protein